MSSIFELRIALKSDPEHFFLSLAEYSTSVTRDEFYEELEAAYVQTEITPDRLGEICDDFHRKLKDSQKQTEALNEHHRKLMELLPKCVNDSAYNNMMDSINEAESSIEYEEEQTELYSRIMSDLTYALRIYESNDELKPGKFILQYYMD